MEFKGTKGVWQVDQHKGYDYDIINDKAEHICWLGFSDSTETEREFDAKLIAQAPSLLITLQGVLNDELDDSNVTKLSVGTRAKINNIIKKATA